MALCIDNREWCSSQNILKDEAMSFFERLYGKIPNPSRILPSNIFSRLKLHEVMAFMCTSSRVSGTLLVMISLNGSKKIKSFTADVRSYSNEKWVHLFSNGVVARNSESALASGVVHDLGDKWILGFTRYLGSCTPFEAKLWGILDGLLILLNKGYKCATIQTDNLEVVNALTVKGWKI
ncbi:hypothetical protein Godav_002399 [Gossypium davidsonii]|uniref:RNase H type-1 domain-containing protein n=1 Tax=Gossypium davidsonii TaxID=34287 RepID=A0A7J8SW09_GOSDV|nr:hypothetical protein [Gossypium davidsonii]